MLPKSQTKKVPKMKSISISITFRLLKMTITVTIRLYRFTLTLQCGRHPPVPLQELKDKGSLFPRDYQASGQKTFEVVRKTSRRRAGPNLYIWMFWLTPRLPN